MTGAIVLALAIDSAAAVAYDVSCARRCAELRVEAAVPSALGNRLVNEMGRKRVDVNLDDAWRPPRRLPRRKDGRL